MNALIERIKAKSHEDGGCWIWDAAMAGGKTPVISNNKKVENVRRVLAIDLGYDVKDKTASNSCNDRRCVCPDHIKVMTRKALQTRSANVLKGTVHDIRRGQRISASKRKTAKHSMELATAIRMAEGTQREIARAHGVTQHVVWSIRTYRTWKNYSNPFAQLVRGRI